MFWVFFSPHLLSPLYNKSLGSQSNATNYLTFNNSQKNILSFINFLKVTDFVELLQQIVNDVWVEKFMPT